MTSAVTAQLSGTDAMHEYYCSCHVYCCLTFDQTVHLSK